MGRDRAHASHASRWRYASCDRRCHGHGPKSIQRILERASRRPAGSDSRRAPFSIEAAPGLQRTEGRLSNHTPTMWRSPQSPVGDPGLFCFSGSSAEFSYEELDLPRPDNDCAVSVVRTSASLARFARMRSVFWGSPVGGGLDCRVFSASRRRVRRL